MRRVRITLWTLVLVAVLATGTLSAAMASAVTTLGIAIAVVSGVIAFTAALLALRILAVVTRRS